MKSQLIWDIVNHHLSLSLSFFFGDGFRKLSPLSQIFSLCSLLIMSSSVVQMPQLIFGDGYASFLIQNWYFSNKHTLGSQRFTKKVYEVYKKNSIENHKHSTTTKKEIQPKNEGAVFCHISNTSDQRLGINCETTKSELNIQRENYKVFSLVWTAFVGEQKQYPQYKPSSLIYILFHSGEWDIYVCDENHPAPKTLIQWHNGVVPPAIPTPIVVVNFHTFSMACIDRGAGSSVCSVVWNSHWPLMRPTHIHIMPINAVNEYPDTGFAFVQVEMVRDGGRGREELESIPHIIFNDFDTLKTFPPPRSY